MESDYMNNEDAKGELKKIANKYESLCYILMGNNFDDEELERLKEIKEAIDCLHCILLGVNGMIKDTK